MDDQMHVLFVSERAERRASVENAFAKSDLLHVTCVPDATSALDALSERDADCVATDHATTAADSTTGTDALHVLRLVRDTDPAVPVVVFEAAGADSVASDAISLDVTEYVRESEHDDPLGALVDVCQETAAAYRAEQDVAMLNDLARNVYERVTDGFFALDRDWQFTYLNDAAEEILEVPADDVVGENVWEAFPGAVGTDFYTEYHRAMAAQEPVTFREHYAPLEKTFEVRAFPSEDGLSVHFRTVVDDEDAEVSDHLLELTELLSSDLQDSIAELRDSLEAARAATASDEAGPPEELDDALAAVERMESMVDYSIRLASERPMSQELEQD